MRFLCSVFGVVLLGGLALAGPTLVLYSSGVALIEEERTIGVESEGALVLGDFPSGILWESLTIEGVAVKVIRLPKATGAQAWVDYVAQEPGPVNLILRYLTTGLGWSASYDAAFTGEGLRMVGKVRIENEIGLVFPGARLTLVAGEVRPPRTPLAPKSLALAAEASREEAFEYHRYTLPGSFTLDPGVMVIPFLSGDLRASQIYRYQGGPVEVVLRAACGEEPLPAGEVRVYAEGIYVGSDQIGHTPPGQSFELTLGAAFDLTGERVQLSREKVGEDLFRETWQITLRSGKEEGVVVEAIETLPGFWRILNSDLPYEILDAQRVKFAVPVPPGGEGTVKYLVEWRY